MPPVFQGAAFQVAQGLEARPFELALPISEKVSEGRVFTMREVS
jgi:hypothetical protein